MKKIKFIFIPRILIVIYVLFISLFALDTKFVIGFFIQLIPSLIFLATLFLTWKKPKIAGIFFIIEGLGTILFFNTYRNLFILFIISIIPIVIGTLFFFSKNPKH
jgi:hypothetical protein